MELKVISQRSRSKFSSNNSWSSKEKPMGSRVVKQSSQEAGDAAQGALCWHIKHIHLLYIRLCLAQTMTENCWEFPKRTLGWDEEKNSEWKHGQGRSVTATVATIRSSSQDSQLFSFLKIIFDYMEERQKVQREREL